MLILDSIESGDDAEYWKQELNKTSDTNTGDKDGDNSFACTLEYHYSSIFNDDADRSIDDGNSNEGDVDMKVPTSEELTTAQRQLVLQDSLLAHFKAIKDKTNHKNLFYNTVRVLTDKILEELDTWC